MFDDIAAPEVMNIANHSGSSSGSAIGIWCQRSSNFSSECDDGGGGVDGILPSAPLPSSSSMTLADLDAVYRFEAVVRAVVPVAFGLIAAVGLAGNLLVIAVVLGSRRMRTSTNVLIINLAVADLLFIVLCVPGTAVGYALPVWPFGVAWCRVYQYVIHVTAYASVYTLVLMSLDRYLAVVHPIRSMTVRTERNASVVAAVAWTIIVAVNAPVLAVYDVVDYTFVDGENRSSCLNVLVYVDDNSGGGGGGYDGSGNGSEGNASFGVIGADNTTTAATDGEGGRYRSLTAGRIYHSCFFAFAYVVPLALVCLLYGLMVRRLLRGGHASRAAGAGNGHQELANGDTSSSGGGSVGGGGGRRRGKRRVTRLIIVVTATFAACWLPLQVVLFVQFVVQYPDEETEHSAVVAIKIACNCLAYVNSCVNPFLYAFLSENFRKSFRRVLCGVSSGGSGGGGAGSGASGDNGDGGLLGIVCCRHRRYGGLSAGATAAAAGGSENDARRSRHRGTAVTSTAATIGVCCAKTKRDDVSGGRRRGGGADRTPADNELNREDVYGEAIYLDTAIGGCSAANGVPVREAPTRSTAAPTNDIESVV